MEDEDDARHAPLLVADGSAAVVNGDFRAATREEDGVVGEADDLALAQDLFDRTFDRGARLLVDYGEDLGERAALCFRERPAGQTLGHRVHELDAPRCVRRDDGVADALERSLQRLAAQARLRFGAAAALDEKDGEERDADEEDVRQEAGEVGREEAGGEEEEVGDRHGEGDGEHPRPAPAEPHGDEDGHVKEGEEDARILRAGREAQRGG